MGTTRLFRRRFISPVAAAGGAALTAPKSPAVPCKVVMKGAAQSLASGPHPPAVSVAIPSNHADGVMRVDMNPRSSWLYAATIGGRATVIL
jgi:hypothetical protein